MNNQQARADDYKREMGYVVIGLVFMTAIGSIVIMFISQFLVWLMTKNADLWWVVIVACMAIINTMLGVIIWLDESPKRKCHKYVTSKGKAQASERDKRPVYRPTMRTRRENTNYTSLL